LLQEKHFTIAELANRLHISVHLARKLFADEPGVIAIGDAKSNGRKRRYVTLRVPESVAGRVYERLRAR